jgi:aspartate racemase
VETIGLIGGLSFESTLEYYRWINEAVQARLGGVHSARIVLDSFDFAEVERLQHAGAWDALAATMTHSARRLGAAGAGFLVIASNTMHRVAQAVERDGGLPVLHIADPTAGAIRARGLRRVGLLGTAFTMEERFYRARLEERFGLEVVIPDASTRREVHRIIYEELVIGRLLERSRAVFRAAVADLVAAGAEGAILGCTEIGLLLKPEDVAVPVFDTARLHAEAAAQRALAGS